MHAGIGEDLDLVVAAVDDANIHQLRQLVDILVALVLQRRGRGIVGAGALQLGVELGDLLHRIVGGVDRRVEPVLRLAAQRLDAVRHAVELLRQRLRRIEHADAGRLAVGAGRQPLHRADKLVERGFQRAGVAGRAIDGLQAAEHRRTQVGIGCAGLLGADLLLQVQIELAVDAGDIDVGSDRTGNRLHLVDGLADVARRFGVGDIRRRQRQRELVGAQARHGDGESLAETHDKRLFSVPCRTMGFSAARSGDPGPSSSPS